MGLLDWLKSSGQRKAEPDSKLHVNVDTSGNVQVNVKNAAEAKLAIKELRLIKKTLGIRKRAVATQQKAVRSQYTDYVRRRGSKVQGGGGLGKFFRLAETADRDAKRAALANALAPLDREKQQIEIAIQKVDLAITQLQVRY